MAKPRFHVQSYLRALDKYRLCYEPYEPARHRVDVTVDDRLFREEHEDDADRLAMDLLVLRGRANAHLHYMDGEMRVFAAEGRADKAMRWLCWMQGVLWFGGMLDLAECRDDVYRVLNDGRDPEPEAK